MPAAIVFVVCAAFVLGADPWDPLAGWGLAVVLATAMTTGLTWGRMRALLVVLALVPLSLLNRATEPAVFYALALPALIVMCAVLIAVGVGLSALIARRSDSADRVLRAGGIAIACVATALTAWGFYLDQRVVDRSPANSVIVDQRTGAFRGVQPGDKADRARRLFGEPVLGSSNRSPSPLGQDTTELSGPSSSPADWRPWRYQKLVVIVSRGRVRGYATTDRSAQTAAGVGVGDSLVIAERAYTNLDCSGVQLGSDAENPQYLACQGRLPSGDEIWFGGDPIDSIWVLQATPSNPVHGRAIGFRR